MRLSTRRSVRGSFSLLLHVVPHPMALRTNGLPIARLTDQSLLTHQEMQVRAIRRTLLSWSPSIFVSAATTPYASDEEMLRHAVSNASPGVFDEQPWQLPRRCVRGLAMAAASASPICLAVPIDTEGRPIFRLEQLAHANGIVHGRAHDALSDVGAVLEPCRLVYQEIAGPLAPLRTIPEQGRRRRFRRSRGWVRFHRVLCQPLSPFARGLYWSRSRSGQWPVLPRSEKN